MFIVRSNRRAFTFLEVVIGVAMIALVTLSIYRFLDANLSAIAITSQQADEQSVLESLTAVIQSELNRLPPDATGALLGEAHVFQGQPSDEMTWVSPAGNGLFTENAKGEYQVTLRMKPAATNSKEYVLGIRRLSVLPDLRKEDDWLPLMTKVKAIEFRYFDTRQSVWVEQWTDQNSRPSLVRMRLWREADEAAKEYVFATPPTNARGRRGRGNQPVGDGPNVPGAPNQPNQPGGPPPRGFDRRDNRDGERPPGFPGRPPRRPAGDE